MTVRVTRHRWGSHLPDNLAERPAFRQEFEITQDGVVELHFKCETSHRGIVNGVIGVGARGRYRAATTQAGLSSSPLIDIEGAVGGCNILNVVDHYGSPSFHTALAVGPGWYRFEIYMASYSSIPHIDGQCAQINNQTNPASAYQCYNTFMTIERPGVAFVDLTPLQ